MTERISFCESPPGTIIWKPVSIPIRGATFWLAFQDYVSLQNYLPSLSNVRLVEGQGEIGTIISYTFLGVKMSEQLIMKDDLICTCKTQITEENEIFSRFDILYKVNDSIVDMEDKNTSEVIVTIRLDFKINQEEERRMVLTKLEEMIPFRIHEILQYIVNKVGTRIITTIPVFSKVETIWNKLKDWKGTYFHDGVISVEMDNSDTQRKLVFGDKLVIIEKLCLVSEEEKLLKYEMLENNLIHIEYGIGSFKINEENPFKCCVIHEMIFMNEPGTTVEEINMLYLKFAESLMKNIQNQCRIEMVTEDRNSTKKFSLDVEGTVRAPIQKIWAIIRKFGKERLEWMTNLEYCELEPPGIDDIGAFRIHQYKNSNRFYRERLDFRDDDHYEMKYALVDACPIALNSFTAEICTSIKSVVAKETVVRYICSFDCQSSIVATFVTDIFKEYLEMTIKDLDNHFNSVFGLLKIRLLEGKHIKGSKLLFQPDPYVRVQLVDGSFQQSKTCYYTTEPKWNQEFNFEIQKKNQKVKFMVYDDDLLGKDDLIGETDVDLGNIPSGHEVKLNLIIGSEGCLILSILMVTIESNCKPSHSKIHTQSSASFLDGIKSIFLTVYQDALYGKCDEYEWDKYKRYKLRPEFPLEELPGHAKMLPSREILSPIKLALLFQRAMEGFQSQISLLSRLEKLDDDYLGYFGQYLEIPTKLVEHWRDDEEFCRQLIQGTNPLMIEVAKDMTRIPFEMQRLTAQGKTIPQLIDEKRLFIVDYKLLADIPLHENFKFYAPFVLIYKELLPEVGSRLMIMGIQLTRNQDDTNIIYTPNSHPNRYLFAKIHVQSADYQIHQFSNHLGYCHLFIEPIAVSHNNHLRLKKHRLHILLEPHFQDTIGINFLGRASILSPVVPMTDATFSVGAAGGMLLFLNANKNVSFLDRSFPNELKSRGFDEQKSDELEGYYFREDGFKLWNALKKYVNAFIDRVYANDDAVLKDAVLQDFASSINNPNEGNISGFPQRIESKEHLVELLTTIIFTASAQHAAVNLPQYDYYSYIPNRPESLTSFMPEGDSDITRDVIQNALPNLEMSQFQIIMSHLVSTPSNRTLDQLNALVHLYPDIDRELHTDLHQISEEIQARNSLLVAEGKFPYPYLDPKKIPLSIDV